MIEYRSLRAEEIRRELFQDFVRHQVVTKCWRREKGEWVIRDAPFVDDWTEEDYQFLVACLKNTVKTGGLVRAAFEGGRLKGFASVEPGLFGGEERYLDLSSLHVSEDRRGRGIGKSLFLAAEVPLFGGQGMGQGKRGGKAVHLRPFRCGEPSLLP